VSCNNDGCRASAVHSTRRSEFGRNCSAIKVWFRRSIRQLCLCASRVEFANSSTAGSPVRAYPSLFFRDRVWTKSNLIYCPKNLWSASPTACLDLTAVFCWPCHLASRTNTFVLGAVAVSAAICIAPPVFCSPLISTYGVLTGVKSSRCLYGTGTPFSLFCPRSLLPSSLGRCHRSPSPKHMHYNIINKIDKTQLSHYSHLSPNIYGSYRDTCP
jgi:hypothetical protein